MSSVQDEEQALLRGFAELETSAISDVLDGLGFPGQVLAEHLVPLTGQPRMVGRAACAHLAARDPDAPPAGSGDYFSAIDELAAPGRVLVLAVPASSPGAAIGGFMGREYQRRGATGVLTNGAIRDAAELQGLGLAVFGAGVTPRNGARQLEVASVDAPVALPASGGAEVRVAPGDWIVADPDGIVVVPSRIAAVVLQATRVLAEAERQISKAMSDGMTRIEAMRAHNRFAHLPALRASLAAGR
jgi:4-hydroxy-4-methyl-2-oxoglutarate aldolase